MRARRIKTGFHRIGVVLAVLLIVPGAVSIAIGAYLGFAGRNDASGALGFDASEALGFGAALVGAAALLYAAARALGWIIAGFAGDGDQT